MAGRWRSTHTGRLPIPAALWWAALFLCQHRDKREPISSVYREPGFEHLIGGDEVENSISVSM